MDIMTIDDRELILSELYKLQHPAGPSLEQVIQEQRSWSSEYSDHSSSTPREDLTELVGFPIVRSQPVDMDPEPTDAPLETSVDSGRYGVQQNYLIIYLVFGTKVWVDVNRVSLIDLICIIYSA